MKISQLILDIHSYASIKIVYQDCFYFSNDINLFSMWVEMQQILRNLLIIKWLVSALQIITLRRRKFSTIISGQKIQTKINKHEWSRIAETFYQFLASHVVNQQNVRYHFLKTTVWKYFFFGPITKTIIYLMTENNAMRYLYNYIKFL